MSRGINENDVHTAADQLLAMGERPTIDRIRAHLGTGSPNTVTRWLDTWWRTLGKRLEANAPTMAIPEAPENVVLLAGKLWESALEAAHILANQSLEEERVKLARKDQALEQERAAMLTKVGELEEQVAETQAAHAMVIARSTELDKQIDHLKAHLEDMSKQRAATLDALKQTDDERLAAEMRILDVQELARIERDNLTSYIRAFEDRAHAEVDRARQEIKALEHRLAVEAKEHQNKESLLRSQLEQSQRSLTDAQHAARIQQVRADALEVQLQTIESQLQKLADLPKTLEDALQRYQTVSQPRRKHRKKVKSIPTPAVAEDTSKSGESLPSAIDEITEV